VANLILPSSEGVSIYPAAADLPSTAGLGELASVIDTESIWQYTASGWQEISSISGTPEVITVADTASVQMVKTVSELTSNLKLSAGTADAGNLIVSNSIVADGLKSQISTSSIKSLTTVVAPLANNSGELSLPAGTAITNGYLATTDYATFSGKVSPSRSISTSAPLSGGGDLSADRTIELSAGGIDNSHIANSAAIALTKLASGTAGKIIQTNSSTGVIETGSLNTADLVTLTGTQTLTSKTIGDKLNLGTTGSPVTVAGGAPFTLYTTSSSSSNAIIDVRSEGNNPASITLISIGGTYGSPADSNNNTTIGALGFMGRFGGGRQIAADVSAITASTTVNDASLMFRTGNTSGGLATRLLVQRLSSVLTTSLDVGSTATATDTASLTPLRVYASTATTQVNPAVAVIADVNTEPSITTLRTSGTLASPTDTALNANIGNITAQARLSATTRPVTQIISKNTSTTLNTGQVIISTGTGSGSNLAPRLTIDEIGVTASGTGFFQVPAGTTAQRPTTMGAGGTRWNTSTARFEVYNGTSWVVTVGEAAAQTITNKTLNFGSNTMQGRTTGTAVAAGEIGQQLIFNSTALTVNIASNSVGDIASLSVTAGVWLISGSAYFSTCPNNAVTSIYISSTSGAAATAANMLSGGGATVHGNGGVGVISTRSDYFIISATTTFYLVGSLNGTGTATATGAEISAVRIA
jgi:hypothetical protein